MSKHRAIFFDRDNTLIVNDAYLGDPSQVVLVPGAADAVAGARALEYAVVIVSNQSGVARGMFDEDAVKRVNARLDELLQTQNPNAIIDRHAYCPFHPEASVEAYRCESDLRKPSPGMLRAAADALDLDLTTSWMIGDSLRDIEAGKAAGCRTIWMVDPSFPASTDFAKGNVTPDFNATSLSDAMRIVSEQPTSPTPVIEPAPPAQSSQPAQPAKLKTSDKSGHSELLLTQILDELRSSNPRRNAEFSLPRLTAGILQVLALAAGVLGYMDRDPTVVQTWLLVGIFLQCLTLTLLVMGR